MTREEVALLVGEVRMTWPHSNLGDRIEAVVEHWHLRFFRDVEYADALAAVLELGTSGREHAPPPGVILKASTVRAVDPPEWDEARAEILRAIRTYRAPARNPDGSPRLVASECDLFPAPPPEWWSHPILAAFMAGAWQEWRMAPVDDGTFNAQQRNAYAAMRDRSVRDVGLRAVGASRHGGLGRIDAAGLLPQGGGS